MLADGGPVLPGSWRTASLAELGATVTSGSRGWAAYYAKYGDLFVRITNLRRENIRLDLSNNRHVVVPTGDTEATRTRLAFGDLLISITADIGIVGFIDADVPDPAYINQHIARVRLPTGTVWSKFVAYYLSSWGPQRAFVGAADTGAKAGMNLTAVGQLRTVVPPVAEQRAIAEALSDADDLISTLERLIAKKESVKLGLLQELLTGNTRLPGFRGGWSPQAFGSLATPVRERVHPAHMASSTLLVELEHIANGTGSLIGRGRPDSALSQKTPFRAGDVLFGRLRSYLRKFWLADEAGICSTEIWVFRPAERVVSAFLRAVVETDAFVTVASGGYGTHMPRADWRTVRELEVIVPPVEEQLAIAQTLSDADDDIAVLRVRLVKARAVKQGMMQELLTGRTRLPVAGEPTTESTPAAALVSEVAA